MLRWLAPSLLSVGLLCGGATARAEGTFEIPCQPREAFVSRLRALVQLPQSADGALRQFVVTARELGPHDWLLLVRREADAGAPRSVRDTSCEAVSEAAALVTARWIDELAGARPLAAPTPHLIIDEAPEEHTVGVSLLLDASRVFMRAPVTGGLGTSLMIFIQDMRLGTAHLGVRFWPTELRLHPVPQNLLEQRGPWEFLIGGGGWFGRWGDIALGVHVSLAIGARATHDRGGSAITPRADLALVARYQLARAYFIRYQLGFGVWQEHPQRAALVGALGLDILAFDL